MPRKCTVCAHPGRATIDELLLGGGSNRTIARQFSLTRDALARHKRAHLPASLVKAHGAAELARADSLLGRLKSMAAQAETLHADAERILRGAFRRRDHDTALEAIRTACHPLRELRGMLSLMLETAVAGVPAEVNRRLRLELENLLRQAERLPSPFTFDALLNLCASAVDAIPLEVDCENENP